MSFRNNLFPGGTLARLILYISRKDINTLYPSKIYIDERANISIDTGDNVNVEKVAIKNISTNKIILELFKELNKFKNDISVFIHGSWGDDTNNSFSDMDDFIVINESKFSNNRLKELIRILNKIDMKMCRIDPLQHHGHWTVLKQELLNYNNSYIPLFILKEAELVIGSNIIKSSINDDLTKKGINKNVFNTIESVKKSGDLFLKDKLNYYRFKAFISSISLIPPLLFQYNNIEITKKDAINRASELFSNESLNMILWATQIRQKWDVLDGVFIFKIFKKLSCLFFNPFLWRKFSYKYSPKINKTKIDTLSEYRFNRVLLNSFVKECESKLTNV